MVRSVLIAGASGLVGSEVLRQALADPRVERVVVLARRAVGMNHPKLVEWISGEGDLLAGLKDERVDAVICCLGTTIRNVGGDRSKFVHVDKELVIRLGAWAKENAVPSFSVVSAIGADPNSRVFYNQVKGEMEEGLCAVGLPRVHIFHPSILTGPRKEFRLGERIGIGVMTLLGPLMIGPLADYKPMPSEVLARALLNVSLEDGGPSVARILSYRDILAAAAS